MNYLTAVEQIGIEKGIKTGMEKGLEKGFQQGLHEGEATFLIRLLKLRFEKIPSKYKRQIQQADHSTLLLWGERVFDADSIEDIFI